MIYTILLIACGVRNDQNVIIDMYQVISWIVGYIKNDFYMAVYGWMIGLGLALLVNHAS